MGMWRRISEECERFLCYDNYRRELLIMKLESVLSKVRKMAATADVSGVDFLAV